MKKLFVPVTSESCFGPIQESTNVAESIAGIKFGFQSAAGSQGQSSPRIESFWIQSQVQDIVVDGFDPIFVLEVVVAQQIKIANHFIGKTVVLQVIWYVRLATL